jgi:archaellum component FlaG (FlaF/FlaG flagellin family)
MALKKMSSAAIIAIAIAGALLTVTTLAALNVSENLSSTGTITAVNLDIYSDSACTIPITSISWGNVAPGSANPTTIYIKNTGNVAETLTMTSGSWTPSNANTYLTLTWNRQNTVLAAGASTSATLTLTAASNCGSLTTFSFTITITGTQ